MASAARGTPTARIPPTARINRASWRAAERPPIPWAFERTEQCLGQIMARHPQDARRGSAEAYGMPDDYLAGANIAGFARLGDAMLAHGVI